jgi:hypothetical protein
VLELNHALPPSGDVSTFEISGSRVVYTATDGLFSVPIDGSSPPVKLSF